MSDPIVVDRLTVEVVTGECLMDHGPGFSEISACVVLDEPTTIDRLEACRQADQVVTLRCARLEVVGRVTRSDANGTKTTFIVSIDDLTFRDVEPQPVVRRIRGS